MICPYCLEDVKLTRHQEDGAVFYTCPICGQAESIPPLYVEEYDLYPPIVMNAIGFRGHGKTVYFSCLFHALYQNTLSKHWEGFYTMSLDEESLETVNRNRKMLEEGLLPASTQRIFPRPTMVRLSGIPIFGSRTLLFYDTGGEAFERSNQIRQYARFVKRATTAVLLISVGDLKNPAEETHNLLNTYVVSMSEMGAETKNQSLLIVYTKADVLQEKLQKKLEEYPELLQALQEGSLEALKNLKTYMRSVQKVSKMLARFTSDALGASNFANFAEDKFRSVDYSIVSALGACPAEGHLKVAIQPRRIMDPLLWVLNHLQDSETDTPIRLLP